MDIAVILQEWLGVTMIIPWLVGRSVGRSVGV